MRKREHINKFLSGVRSSIGLYPALISLAYFVFAIVLVNSRHSAISEWLADRPWLSFESLDTPTAILTTLIGSIISLMVLSFSMVMVVLSQASSSFSPKILRGLVSDKSNQVVLGNYLGSILFCMVSLGNFNNEEDIPLLSAEVLMSIIFGLWCLVLFVFFIHNASLAIQANEVIIRHTRELSTICRYLWMKIVRKRVSRKNGRMKERGRSYFLFSQAIYSDSTKKS
ncbi:DUF2254 family protein [Telluribacter humicola]|uniref:DUF2254 family protein n=1 Tax=Telluribacter humicola TaxID=1720261 RepID=UPI00286D8820|nr:DUF2254 family protein [Telluribacter humicola]